MESIVLGHVKIFRKFEGKRDNFLQLPSFWNSKKLRKQYTFAAAEPDSSNLLLE